MKMELKKSLNALIEQELSNFMESDTDMLIKCIQMESKNKDGQMLTGRKEEKNNKVTYVFSDSKLNSAQGDNSYMAAGTLWLLLTWFEQYSIKVSASTAFYILTFVKYPVHCQIYAYLFRYLMDKKGVNDSLTIDNFCQILLPHGMPNEEFLHKFWDLVKSSKQEGLNLNHK